MHFGGGSGVAGGPIGVAAHTAPPGIVGRAGTAGGSSLAGLSASWGIVRRGGLIGVARRAGAFFIFMRPRRGSRVRAECPQGDRPLQVFLYSEAFRCRRICARPSCWIGPAHGMRRRICVGPLAGILALTWFNDLTAVARFALSWHSAVSDRFCTGRPPLWCRRYVPRVSEVRGGICSFDLIMSMLLLACVVGSAIVAFGDTLFGERFR